MQHRNTYPLSLALLLAITTGLSGCGGGSSSDQSPATQSYSYASTSSKGDYSEWTITGDQLTADWAVVDTNGAINYTFHIDATCGAADSFGVKSCSIDTSSCADGAMSCPTAPSGSFDMMDVPGVALFAQTGSGSGSQLHIGFALDSGACSEDVSGDYSVIRTGLGQQQNFGMYRSDANFINILHSDFGFSTTTPTTTPTVVYTSGSEAAALTDGGCVEGVRTRTLMGETIRSMMTASGLFVLDLPSGQGGLISFKTGNAASLSDFASKSFGGISFPDDADPDILSATTGPVSGGKVSLSVNFASGGSGTGDMLPLSSSATATSPAYPDFSVAPSGYGSTTLATSYASPADFPGMFKLDNPPDNGRVIFAGMKFNGKVIGVGMVYNYRTMTDINPATGTYFSSDGLYNTGNFLLFEK